MVGLSHQILIVKQEFILKNEIIEISFEIHSNLSLWVFLTTMLLGFLVGPLAAVAAAAGGGVRGGGGRLCDGGGGDGGRSV